MLRASALALGLWQIAIVIPCITEYGRFPKKTMFRSISLFLPPLLKSFLLLRQRIISMNEPNGEAKQFFEKPYL